MIHRPTSDRAIAGWRRNIVEALLAGAFVFGMVGMAMFVSCYRLGTAPIRPSPYDDPNLVVMFGPKTASTAPLDPLFTKPLDEVPRILPPYRYCGGSRQPACCGAPGEPACKPTASPVCGDPGQPPCRTPPRGWHSSPGMNRPQLLSGDEHLEATAAAKREGAAGLILAKCTITDAGDVTNCRILKGLPHMDEATVANLEVRRYTPVVFRGKPVPVDYTFTFRIEADPSAIAGPRQPGPMM
ncbi:energy transducer TonB [Pendulispora albinea]|uniref:Energy transducer TonB n=1 Tax=Pendulispora albinea TaxID=2741071 RepID=A0ABZ2M1T5_9BACT